MTDPASIRNAFTVDVEDYFQVSALAPYIARSEWDNIECRVERNVDRILTLLDATGNRATFFTLGWIAQRHPAMVQRIARAGHEIASHGSAHLRATDQSPAEFLDDISRAKALLEDITGVEVRGYRAPSFSIGHSNPWALDCVARAGYRYSSSIYPVKHDHYGMPDAPRFPFASRAGLMEVPVTTVRMGGRNLPAGGGGYFRLLPYAASRWLLRQVNQRDNKPAMFYCHPWEIDALQPRVAGVDAKSRFRHYINLDRTEARLGRLMRDFRWGRMDEVFPEIARAT